MNKNMTNMNNDNIKAMRKGAAKRRKEREDDSGTIEKQEKLVIDAIAKIRKTPNQ